MATQQQLAETALFGGLQSIRSVRVEHRDGSVVEGFPTSIGLGGVVQLTKHSVVGNEDPQYLLELTRISRIVVHYYDGRTVIFDL